MTKLLTSLALAATITTSHAVIVKAESTFAQAVTDNAGNVIPDGSGTVIVGSFLGAVPDFAASSGSDIANSFTSFGTAGTLGFAGFNGLYEINFTGGRLGAASPLTNSNIYTLIGNGPDLASSTELIAFMHDELFQQDDGDPVDKNPTATLGARGSYVYGGAATANPVDVGGGNVFPGVSMAQLVPEPSSSLLFGLAGLALMMRRKR
jgi:hypothetical protein